jgi:hypothetical protein
VASVPSMVGAGAANGRLAQTGAVMYCTAIRACNGRVAVAKTTQKQNQKRVVRMFSLSGMKQKRSHDARPELFGHRLLGQTRMIFATSDRLILFQ